MYWKSNLDEFPHLSKRAGQIQFRSATSAKVEHRFSGSGLLLTERRTILGPQQLDDALFAYVIETMGSKK